MIIQHISESSGKIYHVNLVEKTCDCPDFKIRRARYNDICKHIKFELDKLSTEMKDYSAEILEDNDSIHFINKHSEEILDTLKIQGIVFEKAGRIYLI